MSRVIRPQIKSVEAALKAYYGNGYLSNAEIAEIFGLKSSATMVRYKKPVIDAEIKAGVPIVVPHCVNTRIAFETWGIDAAELEKNYKKLKALGLD